MPKHPFISLCVPTYNRTHFLKRLLNSIAEQTFTDYEIIVTDNSDNESVSDLVKNYNKLPIRYQKNNPPTTMAANWNVNISLATGTWIKMMHDDDWFTSKYALQKFADATLNNAKFICSHWQTVNETTGKKKQIRMSHRQFGRISKNPFLVFGNNIVGPPSAVMVHNSIAFKYDERMNWLVDVEYYIASILTFPSFCIQEVLINFSHHDHQTTKNEFNNKATEISESLMLWEKYGTAMIRNALNYDAWWRMTRRLQIKSFAEFTRFTKGYPVPFFIEEMLSLQRKIPIAILANGITSKMCMLFSYYFHYKRRGSRWA